MANNCSNYIKVSGKDLTKFREALKVADKLSEQNLGWMDESIVNDESIRYLRYWFDNEIVEDEGGRIIISNWTKWCWMEQRQTEAFCKLFQISMIADYEELGCEVYGRAFYDLESDTYFEVDLGPEELDSVQYNEDDDTYTMDGKTEENPEEFYSLLLDEKWERLVS